jgi:hypothetical protein
MKRSQSLLLTFVFVVLVSPCAVCGEEALRDVTDHYVEAASKAHRVTPAEMSSDAEFVRSVNLDPLGIIPTGRKSRHWERDGADSLKTGFTRSRSHPVRKPLLPPASRGWLTCGNCSRKGN